MIKELNYLDVILLIPLVYGFVKGLKKGLVFEAASIIGLILGIWGAIEFSDLTAEFLTTRLNWHFDYINLVAFILTFIGIVFAVNLVAKFVDKVIDMIAMDFLNKAAGGIFGLLKVGIIIGIIILIFNAANLNLNLIPEEVKQGSKVYNIIVTFTNKVIPMVDFDMLKKSSEDFIQQV